MPVAISPIEFVEKKKGPVELNCVFCTDSKNANTQNMNGRLF